MSASLPGLTGVHAAVAGATMTLAQHLVLWVHVAFVVFTIGPVTLAIMSTPRYIRRRDVRIVRYLARITFGFTFASVGVLIAGIALAQMLGQAAQPWVITSLTLYVVALLLLVLIVRDQRRAIKALDRAVAESPDEAPAGAGEAAAGDPGSGTGTGPAPAQAGAGPVPAEHLAPVERGRIAMVGGVVGVIWIVILVLMVWHS